METSSSARATSLCFWSSELMESGCGFTAGYSLAQSTPIRSPADSAIDYFTATINNNASDWYAHAARGFVRHTARGDIDHIIADFTAAIRLRPREPNLYYFRRLDTRPSKATTKPSRTSIVRSASFPGRGFTSTIAVSFGSPRRIMKTRSPISAMPYDSILKMPGRTTIGRGCWQPVRQQRTAMGNAPSNQPSRRVN